MVNLSEKYGSEIQQKFTKGSLVDGRLSNNIDFVGAKTVKIYTLDTVSLVDYNRAKTIGSGTGAVVSRYGDAAEIGDTIQELTMSQDKAFNGVIDKGNSLDQAINKAGRWLNVQINEVVIPAMDKYKLERMITNNSGTQVCGTLVQSATAMSDSNVIDRISAGRKVLLDNEVPDTGRTLFVSTEVFNFLVKTDYFKHINNIGEKALVKGQVGELFGSPVIEVPANRMPTKTNFIWIHKDAVISPTKIHETKLHTDPPGVSGNLIEARFYYDCFVIKAKKMGVYVDQNQ